MKLMKSVIEVWVTNNLFLGRSKESIEDDFKQMLKQKYIDVDDYSNAMEIIYKEEKT